MSNQVRRAASDSDSESESDSDEEKTKSKVSSQPQEPPKKPQQQKEAESESESDTDSDSEPESRYNIMKRDVNSKMETKATVAEKKGRDVNGARATPADGPVTSKNRKGAKDDKARLQPEKISSTAKKGEKAEQQVMRGARAAAAAAKADKAKAVPAAKAENAKPQATGRKRKASPPPPGASVKQQAQKVELDKSSPLKPKKPASWTSAVEESLVNQLHKDHRHGLVIPNTKGDPYWEKLLKRLPLEGDLTELQLCDKVRRMKGRYHTLKERPKGEGGKLFKSSHEEKIFQLWEEIWGSGAKIPQRIAEEEDSDDESEDTTPAPRQANKIEEGQVRGESSSDDENEEEAENAKRKTAGLNQINAASKVIQEPAVVTPFVSKPRLEFTPLVSKPDKRKVSGKVEEAVARNNQHTKDVVVRDDGGDKGDVVSLADAQLKHLKDETRAFFQELRGSCIQAMEEQRNGSLTGGLGDFAFAGKLFGGPGVVEGFTSGSASQAAVELQKKWREHKIQELALLSERLQLLQEQCRLQQDELKLQNQRLEH